MVVVGVTVLIGFLMDLGIGDPQGWWHPVRGIGWLIGVMEKGLRRVFPDTRGGELAGGTVLVLVVLAVTGGLSWLILFVAGRIHPGLCFLVMCVMCWQILAVKSLKTESMKVYHALLRGDVEGARSAVSMIVGRDTERLTEAGMIRAAVETVAENTSDGVIAPLFYLFLLGPVGGFLYKAVNTMDSMVGYRNDRYLYFGRAAARLDDVMNWIPARIAALDLIASSFLTGYDGRSAWRIWRRDRRKHKSPNSAQTEAVCAGALGICLAGDAWYFGVLHHKPVIGDDLRPVEAEDIRRVNRLLYVGAALAVMIGTGGILCLTAFMGETSIPMMLKSIFLSM